MENMETRYTVPNYYGVLVPVGGPIWRVQSESSDKWYVVDLDVPNCTCPGWATKRNKLVGEARRQGKPDSSVSYECKHVRAALLGADKVGDPQADEKRRINEDAERIKNEFRANKTKQDALKMLADLKKGLT